MMIHLITTSYNSPLHRLLQTQDEEWGPHKGDSGHVPGRGHRQVKANKIKLIGKKIKLINKEHTTIVIQLLKSIQERSIVKSS